jgi:phage repressor protein C with HTH and peptisase S24 domain
MVKESAFMVHGESMEPTLKNGEIIIAVAQNAYDVGDVVVFKPPYNAKFAVKRISEKQGQKYYLLSDNCELQNCFDSRQYGYIDVKNILGKVDLNDVRRTQGVENR